MYFRMYFESIFTFCFGVCQAFITALFGYLFPKKSAENKTNWKTHIIYAVYTLLVLSFLSLMFLSFICVAYFIHSALTTGLCYTLSLENLYLSFCRLIYVIWKQLIHWLLIQNAATYPYNFTYPINSSKLKRGQGRV